MEEMYQLCVRHMNCRVRVHMQNGESYEGVIVGLDGDNVYLQTSGDAWLSGRKGKTKNAKVSGWFGPGFGFGFGGGGILALSLFTLLAIALI
ncbi:hypothetical protein [Cohnella terricola]|uniref:LSM domain-containing protein n=1 Tax=Cohnella terricola TaxID=1289167 RepID=A0A559IVA8_9BACL|nr:hypothetical protein [Cohnella terricola]TVX91526.1 hypothetical protein FPZ45_24975 [Cohnella terricola]